MKVNQQSKCSFMTIQSKPNSMLMNQALKNFKIDAANFYQKSHSSQIQSQNIFNREMFTTINKSNGFAINQVKRFNRNKQKDDQQLQIIHQQSENKRSNSLHTRHDQSKNKSNQNLGRIRNRKVVSQIGSNIHNCSLYKQEGENFNHKYSIKKQETINNQILKMPQPYQKFGFIIISLGSKSHDLRKSFQKSKSNKKKSKLINGFNQKNQQQMRINNILLQTKFFGAQKQDKLLNMFKMEVEEYQETNKSNINHQFNKTCGFNKMKEKNKTIKNWKKHIDNNAQFSYPFNQQIQNHHIFLDEKLIKNQQILNKQTKSLKPKSLIRSRKRSEKLQSAFNLQPEKIQPSIGTLKLQQKIKTLKVDKSFIDKIRQANQPKLQKIDKKVNYKLKGDLFSVQNICGWQARQNVGFGDQIQLE